jgi:hypothetical protein
LLLAILSPTAFHQRKPIDGNDIAGVCTLVKVDGAAASVTSDRAERGIHNPTPEAGTSRFSRCGTETDADTVRCRFA